MTDNFFKRLQDGDAAMWQQFVNILEPNLRRSIRRAVTDKEMIEDLTSQILVNIVAAFGKLDPNYQPQFLINKTAALYTPFGLKPEYRDTPLQDVTIDMLASQPPDRGVIFCLSTSGPAKVLRHETYAGHIFESASQAAKAMHEAWASH